VALRHETLRTLTINLDAFGAFGDDGDDWDSQVEALLDFTNRNLNETIHL